MIHKKNIPYLIWLLFIILTNQSCDNPSSSVQISEPSQTAQEIDSTYTLIITQNEGVGYYRIAGTIGKKRETPRGPLIDTTTKSALLLWASLTKNGVDYTEDFTIPSTKVIVSDPFSLNTLSFRARNSAPAGEYLLAIFVKDSSGTRKLSGNISLASRPLTPPPTITEFLAINNLPTNGSTISMAGVATIGTERATKSYSCFSWKGGCMGLIIPSTSTISTKTSKLSDKLQITDLSLLNSSVFIQLTITDEDGRSASATTLLKIGDSAPTPPPFESIGTISLLQKDGNGIVHLQYSSQPKTIQPYPTGRFSEGYDLQFWNDDHGIPYISSPWFDADVFSGTTWVGYTSTIKDLGLSKPSRLEVIEALSKDPHIKTPSIPGHFYAIHSVTGYSVILVNPPNKDDISTVTIFK